MNMILSVLGASRPISWVNTAFPFGAAYLIAGGGFDLVFWLGVVFFLIPYNIAMYGINDVFDYESDIRNPRKGGVEGAVLSRDLHSALLWASAITVVPFAVYLYAAGTWASAARGGRDRRGVSHGRPSARAVRVPRWSSDLDSR